MRKTRRISLGFLLVALMALCSPATAGVVLFSDLSSSSPIAVNAGWVVNGSGIGGSSTEQSVAEQFTASGTGNFAVSEIDLAVGSFSAAPNTFVASIWNSMGTSLGTQLAAWNLSANTPEVNCCGLATQSGITGVSLIGGQAYFMVLAPVSATDASVIGWDDNNQGATGLVLYSVGPVWYSSGIVTLSAFDVIGVPTPEPGTFGMLGAGLLALGLLRKRLR